MSDSITLTGQTNGTVTLTGGSGGTLIFQGVSQGIKGDKGDQGDPATNLVTSVAGRQGVVVLTKADVGLSNAENTADLSKPISTATQAALDTKATTTALNTHVSNTSNPHSVTKAQVGLGNAENTSDADKPVSTAQQTALDGKANALDTVNLTGNQAVAGIKTFSSSPVVPTATTTTQAVNKSQMDTADALKVSKAGDAMTGVLNINAGADGNPLFIGATSTVVTVNQSNFSTNTGQGVQNFYQMNSKLQDGSNAITFSIQSYMAGASGSESTTTSFRSYRNGSNSPFLVLNSSGLLYPADDVKLALSNTGPQILQGTGFPEGVISAPVGSIYIDKAITNGASSWIKKSGTGNTGWQVLEGDTGERNVASSWMTANVELGTGFLKFRRIGKTTRLWGRVQLTGAGATGARNSNKPIVDMSTFTDTLPNWNFFMTSIVASIYSGRIATINNSRIFDAVALSGGVSVGNWTIGDQIAFNVTWEEVSAWPTTLPGTAI